MQPRVQRDDKTSITETPRVRWWHDARVHWAVLVLSQIVIIAAWSLSNQYVEDRVNERFAFRVAQVVDAVKEGMHDYEQVLRGGVGLFVASPAVSKAQWHEYVENANIPAHYPGIQSMAVDFPIPAAERDAHIASMRALGYPDYTIHPEQPERPVYHTLAYVEPFGGSNLRAFGFDMYTDPTRRAAMDRAIEQGLPTLSGMLKLAQETDQSEQNGFTFCLPVYHQGHALSTPPERRDALRALVCAGFRANDLMRGILGNSSPDVELEIFDNGVVSPDTRLYASLAKDNLATSSLSSSVPVEFGGRKWLLRVSANEQFFDPYSSLQSRSIAIAGLFFNLALLLSFTSLVGRESKARKLANEMTRQIRENEKHLAEINRRFMLAADSAAIGVWEYDITSGALIWDERMYRLYQVDRDEFEVAYDAWSTRLHPEDRARAEAELQAAIDGSEDFDTSFRIVWKNGNVRDIKAYARLERDQEGRPIHVTGINYDVTSIRQAEAALKAAKAQAEEAAQAKTDFLANMSHEIRTPMNAIIGLSQLLLKSELNERQRDYQQKIQGAGQHLLGILNDILDFSKIEAGKLTVEKIEFKLEKVLDNLTTLIQEKVNDKQLELVFDVASNVPDYLIGDPMRLGQILINYANNAVKFTERGEITIQVRVREEADHAMLLYFAVRDTGIGLTDEQRSKLFQSFQQADSSTTRHFGGTGLGLAISKKLAELMYGEVGVDSEYGEGSTFWFTAWLGKSEKNRFEPQPDLGGNRVLLAEDNDATRQVLSGLLSGMSFLVNDVASGTAAVAAVREAANAGSPYEVVLLDWQMPDMNGIETAREIQALGLSPAPHLIMVTAFGSENLLLLAQQAGFEKVIIKPVMVSTLFYTMQSVLGSPDARQGAAGGAPLTLTQEGRANILGAHLLLVEDNSLNQIVARGMLEEAGATIDTADNGEQALALLRADPQRYDAVLMDVQMPVMDGFTTTRLIRSELKLNLPVLAMTAGVTESEQEQCIAAGMNEIIAKPIVIAQMLAAIARHLPADFARATAQKVEEPAEKTGQDSGKVFDPGPLFEMSKSNATYRSTLLALITSMIERGPAQFNDVRLAWDEGRIDESARILHTMRGSIGTLGAARFAARSLELETAIRANQAGRIPSLFELAQQELNETVAAARSWIEHHADSLPEEN